MALQAGMCRPVVQYKVGVRWCVCGDNSGTVQIRWQVVGGGGVVGSWGNGTQMGRQVA